MCLHLMYPQKGFSLLCLIRKGGGVVDIVFSSLTVELTVRVLILLTDLRSDSYLTVFKVGSFVFHIDGYYVNIFSESNKTVF